MINIHRDMESVIFEMRDIEEDIINGIDILKNQRELRKREATLRKLVTKDDGLLATRKKIELYGAAYVYLVQDQCLTCLKHVYDTIKKFNADRSSGNIFEVEIRERYSAAISIIKKQNIEYRLDTFEDKAPNSEIDFETDQRFVEVTSNLTRYKGNDNNQIRNHLVYAQLNPQNGSVKPVEFVYGYNTSEAELDLIRQDFSGSLNSGKMLLTNWKDIWVPRAN